LLLSAFGEPTCRQRTLDGESCRTARSAE
jgi:hypothetical protein